MKNFNVVIKADSFTGIHLNSITVKADHLIRAYDIACEILSSFSDDFSYTVVEIKEI